MKAELKNYRQAPRKVRLVADMVRGMKVDDAKNVLMHTNKRAGKQMLKVLESAYSNAKQKDTNIKEDSLIIGEIRVDKGNLSLKRYRPASRGSRSPYTRESSHIKLILKAM